MMTTDRADTIGEKSDQETAAVPADPAVEADPLNIHSTETDTEGAPHHTTLTPSQQISNMLEIQTPTNAKTDLPHQYPHHLLSPHSAIQMTQPQ